MKYYLIRILGTLGFVALLLLFVILWTKIAQSLGAEHKPGKLLIYGDWGSPGIWFLAFFLTMIPFGVGIYLYQRLRDWYWRKKKTGS